MTMGDRIKKARLAAGMTQQELAGHVGMGVATLSKLEKDRTSPRVEAVERLAAALARTVPHLLYGHLGFWARMFRWYPQIPPPHPRGVVAKTIAVPQTTFNETEDE